MDTSYLPPRLTERCICKEALIRATVCLMGHVTECHYPMDCALAACSHLANHDFETDEIARIRAASREIFDQLADPDCEICQGTGLRQIEITFKELHGIEDDRVEDQDLQLQTPCDCVLARMVHAVEAREERAPNSAREERAPNSAGEHEAGNVQSAGGH